MRTVPFYPNLKDNLHCFQASLRMVLQYFFPKQEYSMEALDKETGHKNGLWTWPMKGLLFMKACGLHVERVGVFDYTQFFRNPSEYLIAFSNSSTAEEQIAHSDIFQAVKDSRQFEKSITSIKIIPTIEMIRSYLHRQYVIICNVNSKALNRKSGYIGHYIVIYKCSSSYVFFHDPGLPPRKSRRVRYNTFNTAWGYPNQQAKNIYAFKI